MELLAVPRKAHGLLSAGSLLLELWMESWVELLLASCYTNAPTATSVSTTPPTSAAAGYILL